MRKLRVYILCLSIILILTGCKIGRKQTDKVQKKDKAPSSLSELSKGLQSILKDIEEIEGILDGTDIKQNESKVKEEESQEGEEQKQAEKQEEGKGNQEKDGTEPKEEDKGNSKPKTSDKDNKILKIWTDVDKEIEDIHKKWNLYEVEGVKKGIGMETRDKLEDALNLLTKSIEERNIINIYDYGSQSMLQLVPIFNMYKDEIKGNINKIKYLTYQSYLKAVAGKGKEGWDLLEGIEEDISQIRIKLEKDENKIKILDKSNLSIGDMQKALQENSTKLYRIKKDIVIKNLDELGE